MRIANAALFLTSLLYGQGPLDQARQLLHRNPVDYEGVEKALREAVAADPADVEGLRLLGLVLARKAADLPTAALDGRQFSSQLLHRLESDPAANPAVLALALELRALYERIMSQADAGPFAARASEIRKRLVRDAQPAAELPCRRIGGGVTAPRLLQKAEPSYNDEARIARHQGAVVMKLAVDLDGRAKDIHLLRSLGFGLDEKAVEAVQGWIFEPAQQNGQPVVVCAQVEVNFRLL